mmetsp:Transcript_78983/g.213818  ORF Transcript_78983/g.213818 Transcript_78983/m.213818 type:complete len:296 (+) Transcript_78983:1030-1917(+)
MRRLRVEPGLQRLDPDHVHPYVHPHALDRRVDAEPGGSRRLPGEPVARQPIDLHAVDRTCGDEHRLQNLRRHGLPQLGSGDFVDGQHPRRELWCVRVEREVGVEGLTGRGFLETWRQVANDLRIVRLGQHEGRPRRVSSGSPSGLRRQLPSPCGRLRQGTGDSWVRAGPVDRRAAEAPVAGAQQRRGRGPEHRRGLVAVRAGDGGPPASRGRRLRCRPRLTLLPEPRRQDGRVPRRQHGRALRPPRRVRGLPQLGDATAVRGVAEGQHGEPVHDARGLRVVGALRGLLRRAHDVV